MVILHTIYERLQTLADMFVKVLMFILILFEEVKMVLIAVLILITFDQFTGVWKAISLKQFNWRCFNKVYTKVILYLIVLIATFFYECYILELTGHYFTKGLAAVIGFQELSSVYLNISEVTKTDYLMKFIRTTPWGRQFRIKNNKSKENSNNKSKENANEENRDCT